MPPENVPDAVVSVKDLPPSVTAPPPDKLVIEAPIVLPEISNVPLSATPDDDAIAPLPFNASVAPELIDVAPV